MYYRSKSVNARSISLLRREVSVQLTQSRLVSIRIVLNVPILVPPATRPRSARPVPLKQPRSVTSSIPVSTSSPFRPLTRLYIPLPILTRYLRYLARTLVASSAPRSVSIPSPLRPLIRPYIPLPILTRYLRYLVRTSAISTAPRSVPAVPRLGPSVAVTPCTAPPVPYLA